MKETARTNKAWESMQQMLDREMPVRKKRRPTAAAWWLSAASIVGLIGILCWTEWYIAQEEPVHIAQKQQATKLEAVADEDLLFYTLRGQLVPNSTESAHTIVSPTTISEIVKLEKAVSYPLDYTLGYPIANTPITEPAIIAENPQEVSTVSETVLTPINAPAHTPFAETAAVPENAADPSLYARLPQVQTELAYNTAPELPEINAAISIRKYTQHTPKTFHLGLSASTILGQVRETPGFLSGVFVDFTPKTTRFGLRSGVYYRFQQLGADNRPVVPVSYDNYLDATNNFQAFNDPSTTPSTLAHKRFSSVLVPLKRVHRLEIPLSLSFKINNKLSAYAGSAFSKVLSTRTDNKGFSTFNNDIIYTPNQHASTQLNQAVRRILPNWEKNWQIGMGYKLWRELEISVYYRKEWGGTSALSDTDKIYDRCISCQYRYENITSKTKKALRPDAMQAGLNYRF